VRHPISGFSLEDEDETRERARTEHLPEFKQWATSERPHWDMALAETVFRVYQQAWHAQSEVQSIHESGAESYASSMGERGASWPEAAYYLRLAEVPAAEIAKVQATYQRQLEQYRKYVAASKAHTPFSDRYLKELSPTMLAPRNKGRWLLDNIDRVHTMGPTRFAQEYASESWGLVSELLRAANVTEDGIQRVRPVWNKANRAWTRQWQDGLLGAQGPIGRFIVGLGHGGEAFFGDVNRIPPRESDLAGWLGAQLAGGVVGGAVGGAAQAGESLVGEAGARAGSWVEGRAGKVAGRAAEALVGAAPEAALSMGQSALGQVAAEGEVDLEQAGVDALRDAAVTAGLRGVVGAAAKAARGRGARSAGADAALAPVPRPARGRAPKRKWIPGGQPSGWQKHPHSRRYPYRRAGGRKLAPSAE
jgi:hypothetical protein